MMFVTSSRSGGGQQPQDEVQFDGDAAGGIEHYSGHDVNDEIIDINVAGKRFQTYKRTLSRFPDSLLGNAKRRNKFLNPDTGELFFDRHRPTFESILYYYQSGVMARPPNVPIHIFIEELIFFDVGQEVIEKLQFEHGLKEVEEEKPLPKWKLFKIMWQFLDDPSSGLGAKIFAVLSILVILVSLIAFVIETLPEFMPQEKFVNGTKIVVPSKHAGWMFSVNTAVTGWFTVEFVLRLICCPVKLKFFFDVSNVIDFLSILPYYLGLILSSSGGSLSMLRVVRVIRVLRVFKLSRHSRGLKILGNTLRASLEELMMLAFFLLVMILIFGSCVYYAEFGKEGTKFTSIPRAFWWAIVTMATVGYGDMFPETLVGQLVGAMAVVCGVLTIALPVPVVVSNFEYYYTRERNRKKTEEAKKEQSKQSEMIARRDRVNRKFDKIRKRLGKFKSLRRSFSESRKGSMPEETETEVEESPRATPRANGDCHHEAYELEQLV